MMIAVIFKCVNAVLKKKTESLNLSIIFLTVVVVRVINIKINYL